MRSSLFVVFAAFVTPMLGQTPAADGLDLLHGSAAPEYPRAALQAMWMVQSIQPPS